MLIPQSTQLHLLVIWFSILSPIPSAFYFQSNKDVKGSGGTDALKDGDGQNKSKK